MLLPPMSNGSPSNWPYPKLRASYLRKGKCDFLGEQTERQPNQCTSRRTSSSKQTRRGPAWGWGGGSHVAVSFLKEHKDQALSRAVYSTSQQQYRSEFHCACVYGRAGVGNANAPISP